MANQLYYYDNATKTVKAVAPTVTESLPTLENIKDLLRHDIGVLTPLSILTVNSNSFLDRLYLGELDVGTITSAEMDGGNF